VAEKARIADTMLARMKGLLFTDGLGADEGLWIEPCNSIHTFGMRFTIDALFLDGSGKVIKIVPRMKPWKMTWIAPKARGVLELPEGQIERTGTRVGDELERLA
jgi:uncharacterized membrane protein (UPF0127 family)